jgi:UDP-2,4-diacetamido-2,4,6-trideoxy-beta-L-altropyranose hydrolase
MSSLLFCTGGNKESGIGHLMRCQALAQAAQDHGIDAVFVVSEAAREIALSRHDWCGKLMTDTADQNALATELLGVARDIDAIAIVVDGYAFNERLLQSLGESSYPLVLLDDIRQPGVQFANLICNPAGREWQDYYQQQNPQATLCLGAEYRLLRREFTATIPLPIERRFSLTINLGGSDPLDYTLPLLRAISEALTDAPIRVVTGPAMNCEQIEAIKAYINDSGYAIQHVHNCQDMADLWSNSRLAITAAGGSQFELAACHTPAVLLVVAENQRNTTEQSVKQGWCMMYDALDCIDLDQISKHVTSMWHDGEKLIRMSLAASDYATKDGAFCLLNSILDLS